MIYNTFAEAAQQTREVILLAVEKNERRLPDGTIEKLTNDERDNHIDSELSWLIIRAIDLLDCCNAYEKYIAKHNIEIDYKELVHLIIAEKADRAKE